MISTASRITSLRVLRHRWDIKLENFRYLLLELLWRPLEALFDTHISRSHF